MIARDDFDGHWSGTLWLDLSEHPELVRAGMARDGDCYGVEVDATFDFVAEGYSETTHEPGHADEWELASWDSPHAEALEAFYGDRVDEEIEEAANA